MTSEDSTPVASLRPRPNLEAPRWDQSTFAGRARHFFTITNPANLLASPSQLDEAKDLVEAYRKDRLPAGTTVGELWAAKHLYDSAFHPDTKEKMLLVGRMSAQVPCNMTITGCMLTFYRSPAAVVFWQWINQSFNAIVNYTNRSGPHPVPVEQLGTSYVAATGGALVTALGLNSVVKSAPPLVGRFVPFAAVAAANCINIPLMRRKELAEGIAVMDAEGRVLGSSPAVAKTAIGKVVVSRICMAAPSMALSPLLMNWLDSKAWFRSRPYLNAPTQVMAVGFLLAFATPLCCAFFPQMSSISVDELEPELRDSIKARPNAPDLVYYNKGL